MSHSRASSSSSKVSSVNQIDLESRATHILMALSNNPDKDVDVEELISASVIAQHDEDDPISSRAAFLATKNRFTREVIEAVVDEGQMMVWVRSEIRGFAGGIIKESIDMMTFNDDGRLVKSEDCQRIIKCPQIRE